MARRLPASARSVSPGPAGVRGAALTWTPGWGEGTRRGSDGSRSRSDGSRAGSDGARRWGDGSRPSCRVAPWGPPGTSGWRRARAGWLSGDGHGRSGGEQVLGRGGASAGGPRRVALLSPTCWVPMPLTCPCLPSPIPSSLSAAASRTVPLRCPHRGCTRPSGLVCAPWCFPRRPFWSIMWPRPLGAIPICSRRPRWMQGPCCSCRRVRCAGGAWPCSCSACTRWRGTATCAIRPQPCGAP